MRTLYTCLAGTVFAGALVCAAPGCGGTNDIERPPEVKKEVNPETDMPGFKDMQKQLKTQGKTKR